jgi:hypothetical protein
MSKMDALRAMREARYSEAQKRSAGSPAKRAARPPVAPPAPTRAAAAKPADGATPTPTADPAGLCGHRNMSGRTCTRETGHPQKSHRYS